MAWKQIFPILSTSDVNGLARFYMNAVDAEVTYQFPMTSRPEFVALTIADTQLGIGLDAAAPGADAPQRTALWLYADDCDEAFRQLITAGATAVSEPADLPWGERVATVTDPDGNVVHVGAAAGRDE